MDDICYLESSLHPLKNDYGQPVTFSKEGRINHKFYWPAYEGNNGASYRLTLCEDGSFTLTVRSSMRLEIEGTYSLENNILTLTSGDSTYYFVCTKDGFTKSVYKKFTTEAVKYWLIEEPPLPEPPAE